MSAVYDATSALSSFIYILAIQVATVCVYTGRNPLSGFSQKFGTFLRTVADSISSEEKQEATPVQPVKPAVSPVVVTDNEPEKEEFPALPKPGPRRQNLVRKVVVRKPRLPEKISSGEPGSFENPIPATFFGDKLKLEWSTRTRIATHGRFDSQEKKKESRFSPIYVTFDNEKVPDSVCLFSLWVLGTLRMQEKRDPDVPLPSRGEIVENNLLAKNYLKWTSEPWMSKIVSEISYLARSVGIQESSTIWLEKFTTDHHEKEFSLDYIREVFCTKDSDSVDEKPVYVNSTGEEFTEEDLAEQRAQELVDKIVCDDELRLTPIPEPEPFDWADEAGSKD